MIDIDRGKIINIQERREVFRHQKTMFLIPPLILSKSIRSLPAAVPDIGIFNQSPFWMPASYDPGSNYHELLEGKVKKIKMIFDIASSKGYSSYDPKGT